MGRVTSGLKLTDYSCTHRTAFFNVRTTHFQGDLTSVAAKTVMLVTINMDVASDRIHTRMPYCPISQLVSDSTYAHVSTAMMTMPLQCKVVGGRPFVIAGGRRNMF